MRVGGASPGGVTGCSSTSAALILLPISSVSIGCGCVGVACAGCCCCCCCVTVWGCDSALDVVAPSSSGVKEFPRFIIPIGDNPIMSVLQEVMNRMTKDSDVQGMDACCGGVLMVAK